MQDPCKVTNATAIQGHLEHWLFDFRHATIMAGVDEKRLVRTAGMLTAVPLLPLGCDAMFNHLGVLTCGTAKLEEGPGDLRYPAF